MARDGMPRVAILLATFQGETYLSQQLDSIAQSTGVDWLVRVSDDGSTDGTRQILDTYRDRWEPGRVSVVDGPRRGLSANFFSLIAGAPGGHDAYAFADQDDVWAPEKLERAATWLGTVAPSTPALYCGRTRLIDATGRTIGYSPRFHRPPSFANALAQNLASGNTMVFNDATRRLLQDTGGPGAMSAMHDWWTYLIVTGVGGVVRYDPEPMVQYRQHGGNQVGGHAGALERAWRAGDLLQGRLAQWTDRNDAALREVRSRLTPGNAAMFDEFSAARRAALGACLRGLWRSGAYRQTKRGRIFFWTAAVLNRL